MRKLTLSGHETFHCRHFWLKKGYDFAVSGQNKFTDRDAVIELGVGKNMVASIRYWMKAFHLIQEVDQEIHSLPLADFIFGEKGVDPFLENPATIWLLHYLLVKHDHASIYAIIFNELRGQRKEFDEAAIRSNIVALLDEAGQNVSDSTIDKDIKTFLKNYVRPQRIKDYEDDLSGLLLELDLVQVVSGSGKDRIYRIESEERSLIPAELILFSILEFRPDTNAISFQDLMNGRGSPGRIFALTADGLMNKIDEITKRYPTVVYSADGGIQQIQILDENLRNETRKLGILNAIYE